MKAGPSKGCELAFVGLLCRKDDKLALGLLLGKAQGGSHLHSQVPCRDDWPEPALLWEETGTLPRRICAYKNKYFLPGPASTLVPAVEQQNNIGPGNPTACSCPPQSSSPRTKHHVLYVLRTQPPSSALRFGPGFILCPPQWRLKPLLISIVPQPSPRTPGSTPRLRMCQCPSRSHPFRTPRLVQALSQQLTACAQNPWPGQHLRLLDCDMRDLLPAPLPRQPSLS